MKRIETWEEFKPVAHWYQLAMVMPHIFICGWRTENGVFALAKTDEHIWLSGTGNFSPLEYAKVLNDAAILGHVVSMVTVPTEIAKQLNFAQSRDVVWMRRSHPFPPMSVSPNITIVTDASFNSEIQRMLQLSAPESSVWPGNPEILFWVVARDTEKEISGVAAGTKWQTGAFVISSVAVAEGARRTGIGSLVTQIAAQEMFSKGAEVVQLGVRATNRGALALYQSIGFDEQFNFTRAILKSKD